MQDAGDTFLRAYSNRMFDVEGHGLYSGGVINYIGVGAINVAYTGHAIAMNTNLAGTIYWNVGQFVGYVETGSGGAGQWQNIYNIPANFFWMNFGSVNATTGTY